MNMLKETMHAYDSKLPAQTWKTNAPKVGASMTQDHNGAEWTWCPFHKKWGRHSEDDCTAKKAAELAKSKKLTAKAAKAAARAAQANSGNDDADAGTDAGNDAPDIASLAAQMTSMMAMFGVQDE